MDRIEYLGFVASLLATAAFLPQVGKTWKTLSADDFSLLTLIMLIVGAGLWTIYGSIRGAPAIWLGNGVTGMLTTFILIVKLSGSRQSVTLDKRPANLQIRRKNLDN